jgi:peroxiredoxin
MLLLLAVAASWAQAPTTAELGKTAPDFTLPALDGSSVSLAALRGKTVVLEWFNPGCPYVKQAHGAGGKLATLASEQPDNVVWLAINSGAPGKQGHGKDTNLAAAKEWSMKHPILLDESGAVGKAYGAMTTPHVYVIDAKGTLVYRGGLDNAPLGKLEGTSYQNHLSAALADLQAGKPVAVPETKPYGCSVKY